MTIITLLTDFGLRDGYPGVMKGVIWKIAPEVQIADISHLIEPQNILQGAIALARCSPYFPAGTIHVAVIDPGVGTERRPIACQLGEHYYVGPDNGLFTLVLEKAEAARNLVKFIVLDQRQYWLPDISHVFHGRDIFAPIAAHLARGIGLTELGTVIDNPTCLDIPIPQSLPGGGWQGQVIEVDNFGNLSTNITHNHISRLGNVSVRIAGYQIDGLVKSFGDRPVGTLIALFGTAKDLIISEVNGNAARTLNARVGDLVEVVSFNKESQG